MLIVKEILNSKYVIKYNARALKWELFKDDEKIYSNTSILKCEQRLDRIIERTGKNVSFLSLFRILVKRLKEVLYEKKKEGIINEQYKVFMDGREGSKLATKFELIEFLLTLSEDPYTLLESLETGIPLSVDNHIMNIEKVVISKSNCKYTRVNANRTGIFISGLLYLFGM